MTPKTKSVAFKTKIEERLEHAGGVSDFATSWTTDENSMIVSTTSLDQSQGVLATLIPDDHYSYRHDEGVVTGMDYDGGNKRMLDHFRGCVKCLMD